MKVLALTDFLRVNKTEVLNEAGPRESKEPGVYKWTLTVLRFFRNRPVSGAGSTETGNGLGYARERVGCGEWGMAT